MKKLPMMVAILKLDARIKKITATRTATCDELHFTLLSHRKHASTTLTLMHQLRFHCFIQIRRRNRGSSIYIIASFFFILIFGHIQRPRRISYYLSSMGASNLGYSPPSMLRFRKESQYQLDDLLTRKFQVKLPLSP